MPVFDFDIYFDIYVKEESDIKFIYAQDGFKSSNINLIFNKLHQKMYWSYILCRNGCRDCKLGKNRQVLVLSNHV